MSATTVGDCLPELTELPLIGILRGYGTEEAVRAAQVVSDRGIRVVEITTDSPGFLVTVQHLSEAVTDLVVGVGTVTRSAQVMGAASAGARFIVTPNFDPRVVKACVDQNLPVFVGAATPTEIVAAFESGATAVKVFPAEQLGGPAYLRAIRPPLGDIPMVPTGGVTLDNALDYLDSGAVALGVGSGLFPKRIAEQRIWSDLEQMADLWVKAIK